MHYMTCWWAPQAHKMEMAALMVVLVLFYIYTVQLTTEVQLYWNYLKMPCILLDYLHMFIVICVGIWLEIVVQVDTVLLLAHLPSVNKLNVCGEVFIMWHQHFILCFTILKSFIILTLYPKDLFVLHYVFLPQINQCLDDMSIVSKTSYSHWSTKLLQLHTRLDLTSQWSHELNLQSLWVSLSMALIWS